MFDELANATVRIECGEKSGSGFHLLQEQIVVTNHHVIEPHLSGGDDILVYAEDGRNTFLELVGYSPKDEHDFAILKTVGTLGKQRNVLQPKVIDRIPRGSEVAFSGFPLGVRDLVVHRAFVSGYFEDVGFHIDGSVNDGNSGGPLIDLSDGKAVGIITSKYAAGIQILDNISEESAKLRKKLSGSTGGVEISLVGTSFPEFPKMIAKTLEYISKISAVNANTGIGTARYIRFALEKCRELGYAD